MENSKSSDGKDIFRETALTHHRSNHRQVEIPISMRPKVLPAYWIGFFLSILILSFVSFYPVPVHVSGIGIIDQNSFTYNGDQSYVKAFIKEKTISDIDVGLPATIVCQGSGNALLQEVFSGSVTSKKTVSPAVARKELAGLVADSMIDGSGILVTIQLNNVARSKVSVLRGSLCEVQIDVGETRILNILYQ